MAVQSGASHCEWRTCEDDVRDLAARLAVVRRRVHPVVRQLRRGERSDLLRRARRAAAAAAGAAVAPTGGRRRRRRRRRGHLLCRLLAVVAVLNVLSDRVVEHADAADKRRLRVVGHERRRDEVGRRRRHREVGRCELAGGEVVEAVCQDGVLAKLRDTEARR